MEPDMVASTGAFAAHKPDEGHAGDRQGNGARVSAADRLRDGYVGMLAGQVIAMLRARESGRDAGRGGACNGRCVPLDAASLERLGDRIIAAGLSEKEDALAALVSAFRSEGLANEQLIDEVFPHTARELGRAWEDDRMSFIEVTLVMTRIQRLLRETLSSNENAHAAASVLFVLPEGEQHTLGALIAVQQLRRMGHAAMLVIGERPARLAELLRIRSFDVAFVSVSSYHALDSARDVVTCLRRGTADALPVVVGGALACGISDTAAEDLKRSLGAQLVSNDLQTAMRAIRLEGQRHAATA